MASEVGGHVLDAVVGNDSSQAKLSEFDGGVYKA